MYAYDQDDSMTQIHSPLWILKLWANKRNPCQHNWVKHMDTYISSPLLNEKGAGAMVEFLYFTLYSLLDKRCSNLVLVSRSNIVLDSYTLNKPVTRQPLVFIKL